MKWDERDNKRDKTKRKYWEVRKKEGKIREREAMKI